MGCQPRQSPYIGRMKCLILLPWFVFKVAVFAGLVVLVYQLV
jgi:hypothetical protein